jgi:uncharacterized delta-60 repeat protein
MKYLNTILLLCLLLWSLNPQAQQLFPDNSFGTDGIARDNFAAGYDDCFALRAQSNGGLIAGGITTNFTQDIIIVRYTASGVPDESFGVEGRFIFDTLESTEMLNFITIQPDDKILFAGYSLRNNVRRGIVGRLNADGTPDLGFGLNGVVEFRATTTTSFTEVGSVKVHSDGSVFVAGTTVIGSLERAFVKKFTATGTEDNSFGTNSSVDVFFGVSNSRNYGLDLEVMPDGGVLLLGRYFITRFQMGLAKFTPQGVLDNSFTGQGKTFFDYTSGQNYAQRLLRLSDNTFYALAHCNAAGVDYQNYIGKFNANGTVVTEYGTNGRFNFSTDTDGNFIWDAVLLNNNLLITDYSFGATTTFSNVHLISAAGEKVSTFGNNGSFILSGLTTYGQGVTSIGNEIYYAGAEFNSGTGAYNFFVRKLSETGSIDNSFGTNGAVTTAYSRASMSPEAMYKSATGDIFTVGTVRNNTFDQYVIKYTDAGVLDANFGNGGVSAANLGGTEKVMDIAVLQNGEAVVLAERGLVSLTFAGLEGNVFTAPGNYSLMRILPNSGFQTSTATNTNINSTQFTRGLKVKEMPDGKFVVLAMSTTATERAGYLLRHNANLTLDNSFGDQGNGRIELNSLTNEESFAGFFSTSDGQFIVVSATGSGFRIRKVDSSGDADLQFGSTLPGRSDYFGLHSDGLNHLRSIDVYPFNGGFYILGIRGLSDYAVAKVSNNGFLQGYIALPEFKTPRGLIVDENGSFTAYGVNTNDAWVLSKRDANGELITSFGTDGVYTASAYDDFTSAAAVVAESNGGFTLLSGQRSGLNGFDNALLRLNPETPTSLATAFESQPVLYPNPVVGTDLTVKIGEAIQEEGFGIYLIDLKGRKSEIKQHKIEGHTIQVRLPQTFNPGIYHLEIQTNKGSQIIKFVKD